LREDTQLELKELQSRLGTTFVVVTHDRAEAMAMADRIAVMDRGRAIQIATPREVYDSPASRFVAAFMGDVNLVPGRLAGQDGADWLVATELARTPFRIRSDCAAPVALGDPVTLAIRPESLVLARDDADPNRIEGELAGLLYLGGSTSCRVRHRSGEILRVSVPGTGTLAELRDGAPVAIGFAPDAAKILLS
jgi:putrescine transport system ATP-binding protein